MFAFLQKKKPILIFLAIVVINICFKLIYLDHSCFWYDETFGLYYSLQDWGLIKHTSEWDMNPPLYYYFLWIWRHLFGISEFSLRFSSVLFSALAAGMLYIFTMKFFNRFTAFLSVLFFTSSNILFFYAHEARVYSIILFLTLFSSYFFLQIANQRSKAAIIALGISNFLLIYAHYLTGFVLFFQCLIVLLFYNKDFFRQYLYANIILITLIFWRFTKKMILLIVNHEKNFWLQKAGLYELKTTLFSFFGGEKLFLFYILITLAGILVFVLRKQKLLPDQKLSLTYVFLCGFGTFFLCYFIGTITPVFLDRYVLYTLPFMLIFIAYLLSFALPKIKIVLSALLILSFIYAFSAIDYKTPKEMDYREAIAFIKTQKDEKTLVLAETKDVTALFSYYYNRKIFEDYKNIPASLAQDNIYFVSDKNDFESIDKSGFSKIILTQSFEELHKENKALLDDIQLHYKETEVNKNFAGLTIRYFTLTQ